MLLIYVEMMPKQNGWRMFGLGEIVLKVTFSTFKHSKTPLICHAWKCQFYGGSAGFALNQYMHSTLYLEANVDLQGLRIMGLGGEIADHSMYVLTPIQPT